MVQLFHAIITAAAAAANSFSFFIILKTNMISEPGIFP